MKRIFTLLILFISSFVMFAQEPTPSSGTIKYIESFKSSFVPARSVAVWLPEAYDATKKYSVLYMHDGQMLFDSTRNWNKQEWKVDETMSNLLRDKKIQSTIVVGIWNTVDLRWAEYFPQKAVAYFPANEMNAFNEYLKTPLTGDSYLKFLVKELKPFIDSTFSTRSDREHTFLAGSSMGALISLYAICEYPEVFGGAACISTHWIGGWPPPADYIPKGFYQYIKANLPSPKTHKIYFDYGSETLDAYYKPYQLEVDKIMIAKGYTTSNWITKEFVGEEHSENSWKKRLKIPLEFLLSK